MSAISVQTKKATELTSISSLSDSNLVLVHDGTGLKKTTLGTLKSQILGDLGDKITALENGKKWSDIVILGSIFGITFKYRYNDDYVFLCYGGSFSNNVGFTAGTGYSPGDGNLPSLIGGIGNFIFPIATDNRYRLAIRYYPTGSTNSRLALISMDNVTVAKGVYIEGYVLIPRNLGK